MGFLKRRPSIKLRVPSEIRAGQSFEGEILLDARRPVPIESVTVELLGTESARISGAGDSRVTRSVIFLRLGGVLSGPIELPEGPTRYRVLFDLPAESPPSFRGVDAVTEYRVLVRAAIPWWPDAEADFEVLVAPRRMTDPRPGHPQVFSSEPSGPDAQEPYVEGSLSASILAPGDTLSGAVALGNVRFNRYKTVRVALIGWQSVRIGRRRDEREVSRYALDLPPVDKAEELAPIRFDLLVPGVPPTWSSTLWEMRWFFEVKAELRWDSDVILRVPLTIVPIAGGAAELALPPAGFAPPSVGSERMQALWRDVARAAGVQLEGESMRGRAGGVTPTEFAIRREHRGKDGIFLVAELEYPSLGIDLDVRGAGGWFRRSVSRAREAAMLEAWNLSVLPSTKTLLLVSCDDRRARVELKDSGQSAKRLKGFVDRVSWMARALVAVRAHLPPPAPFRRVIAGWRSLAERLNGQLHAGPMEIYGEVGGLAARIRTEWGEGGLAQATVLTLRTDGPLRDAGEASGLVESLEQDGAALRVEGREVTLRLAEVVLDPAPLHDRLESLRKLCLHLRPQVGPYR